ncbi:cytochrome c [Paenibacillus sp. N4]|nr:cytochrome c [Paenibacillus vietnamensis]
MIIIIIGCGVGKESGALDGPAEVMAVYKANCVNCHGTELQGKIGPKTNLQEVGKRMSAADITGQIERGGETMPPFKDRLTDEQIAGLAEWLAGKK